MNSTEVTSFNMYEAPYDEWIKTMTTRTVPVEPTEEMLGASEGAVMSEQCQSYQPGTICKDGFVQKAFCRGSIGCYACGNLSDREKPFCLYDELPKHMANESGSPRFYKEQTP